MAKKAAIYPMALLAVHIFVSILQAESPVCFKNSFDSKLEADFSNGDATPLKIKNAMLVEGRTGKGVNLPPGSSLVYNAKDNIDLTEGAIDIWLKPNWSYAEGDRNKDERIIFKVYADRDNIFYLRYRGGHDLFQFYWKAKGKTGGQQKKAQSGIWKKGEWINILINWNLLNTGKVEANIFVNGILTLQSSELEPLNKDIDYTITLGPCDGVIDDFSIYKKRLRLSSFNLNLVNLKDYANVNIRNSGSFPFGNKETGANDLRNLPTGEQILKGIPFKIIHPEQNEGKSLVLLRGKSKPTAPREVVIPVGQSFWTAYFLCASANTRDGIVMTIEVRYDDGSFESIAFRKGEQIHDWWNPKDTDASVIAWQGSNPVKNNLGLGLFEWENPQPAKVVDRFVLRESGNDSTPFIAAITLTGQKPQFTQLRGRGAPVEETILLIEGKSKTTSTGLAKLKIPFDIADASNWHQENIDKYDILIFGDWAMADYNSADVVKKIKDFVKDGGSLLSFDRGLGYRWKGTPLAHHRTKHYIVDSIIDKDHLIFKRPNPITLGDLENIYRGQIYAALRNLAKGWEPLVKGIYLHMNSAAKGDHEVIGLATGKYGKGTVTYSCFVASRDWIISDGGSWGSNGAKLFENLVEWAIYSARKAKGKGQQKINGLCDKPRKAPKGWIPYKISRSVETHFPIDLSYTLDKPAGKHGFVKVGKDGRCVFEDGTPARFWGLQFREVGKENIEQYLDRMVKMGCNIIRHIVRRREGKRVIEDIQQNGWGKFSPSDFFFAEAKKRGIYFYIVIDHHYYHRQKDMSKEYQARSASAPKGVIFIDEEIQKLHKERLRAFFEQKNSITGLRYVDDPAIAFIELYNENSLTTHMYGNVLRWPEPWGSKIKAMWNEWLLKQYENRNGLMKAWTDYSGNCALNDDEDPVSGTVAMADLHSGIKLVGTGWDRNFAVNHKQLSSIRLNDMARFIYEVESNFYTSVVKFIRDLGYKQPIFGTGYAFSPFGLKSQAIFDMVAYGSTSSGSAVFVGPEHNNIGSIYDNLPAWAGNTLAGHPMVNREWYARYPGIYRSLSIVQMFIYGAFQGMDSIALHAPGDPRHVIQTRVGGAVTDPARAAITPIMGLMLRRGDISVGKYKTEIALSPTDTYYVANTKRQGGRVAAYRYLPYIHLVQNRFTGKDGYKGDADVVFTSGLSSDVNLKGAPRAFVSLDNPYQDIYNKKKGRELPASILFPALKFNNVKDSKLRFSGIGYKDHTIAGDLTPGIDIFSIPGGSNPFGVTGDGKYCLGFLNEQHVIAPYLGYLERQFKEDVPLSYRIYLDAAKQWGLIDYGSEAIDKGVITTDTGEISKHYKKKYMTYSAPRFQGGSGFIGGHKIELDDLYIQCKTAFANIIAISLTMQPIKKSDRILILAVGHAGNTGEEYGQADAFLYDPVNALKPESMNASMISEGRLPIIIEPIEADLKITCKKPRKIYPLGEKGNRGSPVSFTWQNGAASFNIGAKYKTIFYEIITN